MKPYNLLIVDDEKRFATMLAKRLSLRGCRCELSFNGRQALEMFAKYDFFLILLDLHLPDIYGTEVLKRMKETDSKTPVIVVTAHGTEADRRECLRLGAYDFVHKPLGIDELMAILNRIEEMSP